MLRTPPWCFFVLALARIGSSEQSDIMSVFMRTGEHTGMFLHAELGLVEDISVKTEPVDMPSQSYQTSHGVNLGVGYSFISGLIAHLNADLTSVPRGEIHSLEILSVGPGCTWYTPFANTFITGNLYFSLLNAQGGNPASIYDRWRFGLGKEILLSKWFGIGLVGSYEGGRWRSETRNDPKWDLSGTRLNLTLTMN